VVLGVLGTPCKEADAFPDCCWDDANDAVASEDAKDAADFLGTLVVEVVEGDANAT